MELEEKEFVQQLTGGQNGKNIDTIGMNKSTSIFNRSGFGKKKVLDLEPISKK